MQKRFRERVAKKSVPEASRRRPRNVPERSESVLAASRGLPGASRERPGASRERPGASAERPEGLPEAPRIVQDRSEGLPDRFVDDFDSILARSGDSRDPPGAIFHRFFRPSVCARSFCERLTEHNKAGRNDTKTHARQQLCLHVPTDSLPLQDALSETCP